VPVCEEEVGRVVVPEIDIALLQPPAAFERNGVPSHVASNSSTVSPGAEAAEAAVRLIIGLAAFTSASLLFIR